MVMDSFDYLDCLAQETCVFETGLPELNQFITEV
jgi:hypothetical protein